MLLSVALLTPRVALAVNDQCAPTIQLCRWELKREVQVYFNQGVLVARGENPHKFRAALRQALAVWNEESTSDIRYYYAGDTTQTAIKGSVVVNHVDFSGAMNVGAYGLRSPSDASPCEEQKHWIDIHIFNTTFNMSYNYTPYYPLAGEVSYEGIVIHELGHSAWGFGHNDVDENVMRSMTGNGSDFLHLYPSDQQCVVGREGASGYTAVTMRTTDNGSTWTGAHVPSMDLLSTFGPGLVGRDSLIDRIQLAGHDGPGTLWLGAGVHGGPWNQWPTPSNGVTGVDHWSSVAWSDYGEILAVWLDSCTNASGCILRYAWTDNSGASYSTGALSDRKTRARVAVAYSPPPGGQLRDRSARSRREALPRVHAGLEPIGLVLLRAVRSWAEDPPAVQRWHRLRFLERRSVDRGHVG